MDDRIHTSRPSSGPPGYPLLGHLPEFLRDKLGFLSRCVAQYGDVVQLRLGRRTLLLSNPNDIQHVLMTNSRNYDKTPRLTSARGKRISGEGLVTSQGETHLRQRRMLQPVFYRKTIEAYEGVVTTSIEQMLAGWRSGAQFEVTSAMIRLTQQVMIRTFFGPDWNDETGKLADALTIRRRYFEHTLSSIFPFPEYVPLSVVFNHRQAIKTIDEAIYRAIQERRQTRGTSNDLLSRFVEARYEDGTLMNDKQIRDEALTFLNSGYETIGAALAWTLYLLSQHSEIESKLLAELDQVLYGRPPCVEDLPKLIYTGMVLSESMRLYPPTWMFVRVARHRDTLPSGVNVRAGSKLYLCQYIVHRHPRYFPHPEQFNPERFSDHAKQSRPRFAYFPFGGGPRVCIGEAYARMEGVLVLASIVQRFKLELLPDQNIVPEAGILLRPENGILMRVERR